MTSSLPQGMELWQLCKFIGDAVAVYALFVLMLAAIRAGMGAVEAPDLAVGAGRLHCRRSARTCSGMAL